MSPFRLAAAAKKSFFTLYVELIKDCGFHIRTAKSEYLVPILRLAYEVSLGKEKPRRIWSQTKVSRSGRRGRIMAESHNLVLFYQTRSRWAWNSS